MFLKTLLPTAIIDKIKARSAHKLWENKRNACENFPVIWNAIPESDRNDLRTVLEFGANWGGNLQGFLDKSARIQATGIDINPIVTKLEHPRYTGIVGNQNRLTDFVDNFFDLSFTISVLDHIPGNDVIASTIQKLVNASRLTILIEPFISGFNGDVSGHSWSTIDPNRLPQRSREEPFNVDKRGHKKFAAHSYLWDYDNILEKLDVNWEKYHSPLHAHGLGPFYYTYLIRKSAK